MYIAILQGEEVENEIDIWCCLKCAQSQYGWSKEQFDFVKKVVASKKPIQVPAEVDNSVEFGKYIKSMKL